jgi:PKD repeat protein
MRKQSFLFVSLVVVAALFYGCGNDNPVASFTASKTAGCYPLTVSFNASGSADPDGSISSYSWNFGDGTTGTGVSVNHTYNTIGSYIATLTVTDDSDATNTASLTITVSSLDGEWTATCSWTLSSYGGISTTVDVALMQLVADPTVILGLCQWQGMSNIWGGYGEINTQTNALVIDWTCTGWTPYRTSGTFTDNCRSFSGLINGAGFTNDTFNMIWISPLTQKLAVEKPSDNSIEGKNLKDLLIDK